MSMTDDEAFVQRTREIGIDRAVYELGEQQEQQRQARIDEMLRRSEENA